MMSARFLCFPRGCFLLHYGPPPVAYPVRSYATERAGPDTSSLSLLPNKMWSSTFVAAPPKSNLLR